MARFTDVHRPGVTDRVRCYLVLSFGVPISPPLQSRRSATGVRTDYLKFYKLVAIIVFATLTMGRGRPEAHKLDNAKQKSKITIVSHPLEETRS